MWFADVHLLRGRSGHRDSCCGHPALRVARRSGIATHKVAGVRCAR